MGFRHCGKPERWWVATVTWSEVLRAFGGVIVQDKPPLSTPVPLRSNHPLYLLSRRSSFYEWRANIHSVCGFCNQCILLCDRLFTCPLPVVRCPPANQVIKDRSQRVGNAAGALHRWRPLYTRAVVVGFSGRPGLTEPSLWMGFIFIEPRSLILLLLLAVQRMPGSWDLSMGDGSGSLGGWVGGSVQMMVI